MCSLFFPIKFNANKMYIILIRIYTQIKRKRNVAIRTHSGEVQVILSDGSNYSVTDASNCKSSQLSGRIMFYTFIIKVT